MTLILLQSQPWLWTLYSPRYHLATHGAKWMLEPFLPVAWTAPELFSAGGNKVPWSDGFWWILMAWDFSFVNCLEMPWGFARLCAFYGSCCSCCITFCVSCGSTGYDRKAVPYLDNADVTWQELQRYSLISKPSFMSLDIWDHSTAMQPSILDTTFVTLYN